MSTYTTDELKRLANRWAFNSGTVKMIAEGFEPADWERLPSESGGNTAHWILGHLVTARHSILRRLGAEEPAAEWEALFDMNAKPDSTEGYPSIAELLGEMEGTSAELVERISGLAPAKAAEDYAEHAFPDGGKSLAEGLAFMHFHESYHVGQLGLLRRIAGKPGFV